MTTQETKKPALSEGIFPCRVIDGFFGEDDKKSPIARINVVITDGPDKGKHCTYEDQVNGKSALYVGRSLRAAGWKGEKLETTKADVAEWVAKTGGASTVEIKHIEIKNGKRAGEIWAKPNSIGRGPKPLVEAKGDTLADANEAMRRAMEADGFGDGGGSDAGEPRGEDDLPFITSAMTLDRPVSK